MCVRDWQMKIKVCNKFVSVEEPDAGQTHFVWYRSIERDDSAALQRTFVRIHLVELNYIYTRRKLLDFIDSAQRCLRKVKLTSICIAPIRKRSDMARVIISVLYAHPAFISIRNKPYLPLPPSWSWSSFTDPEGMGMEGWVDLGNQKSPTPYRLSHHATKKN